MAVRNVTCEYDSARRHVAFPHTESVDVDWDRPVLFVHAATMDAISTKLWVGLVVLTRIDGKTHLLMAKTESGQYTLPIEHTTFDHYSLEQTCTRKLERIFCRESMIVPMEFLGVVQHKIIAPLFGVHVFNAPVMAPFAFVPIYTLFELDTDPLFEDFYPSATLSRFFAKFVTHGQLTIKYPMRTKCYVGFDCEKMEMRISLFDDVAFAGTPEFIGYGFDHEPRRPRNGQLVGVLFQCLAPKRSFLFTKLASGEYGMPLKDLRGGTLRTPDMAAIDLANGLSPVKTHNYGLSLMAVTRTTEDNPDVDFFTAIYKIKTVYFDAPANHEWISLDAIRWNSALAFPSAIRDLFNSEVFHHFATAPFFG